MYFKSGFFLTLSTKGLTAPPGRNPVFVQIMKKRIVCTILWLFAFFFCQANQFSFSGYSIADGLSQSVVICVFQDSRGYIWLGTQNGLNRFDGYNFKVFTYQPDDPSSISNNWIYAITEDREGNLWIGTKGGLNKYFTKEDRFLRIGYSTPYPSDVTQLVYDVKCARNGNILINTPPVLSICNPDDLSFQHFIAPLNLDGRVKDYNIPLLEDDEGRIWMGSTTGMACFLPESGNFIENCRDSLFSAGLSDNNITALWQAPGGNLWIGTSYGLNCLNTTDGTIKTYLERYQEGQHFIRAVLGDDSGNLWVATEGGGMFLMRDAPEGNTRMQAFRPDNSSLFHNIILSLMIDRSKNLWIGTLSGVNKLDLKKPKFQLFRNSESAFSVDLAGNVIASLFKDRNQRIWVGLWGQGLDILDRETGDVIHYEKEKAPPFYIPDNYVHVIFQDSEGNIWIGTRDGILVYDEPARQFIRPYLFASNPGMPALNGLRIFRIAEGHRGEYWIATQNGLYLKLPNSSKTERFHTGASPPFQISSNLVYSVLEDQEGLIWIATANGLDLFDPMASTMKHFRKSESDSLSLADNYVTALCEDHLGNIWIGTTSFVNKFSKRDQSFVYYSQTHGLPGNLVYNIVEDMNHHLWFATGNGLCCFFPETQTCQNYTIDDGLQSAEFNIGAAFLSPDGELFLGGMNGFNAFYPDSIRPNPFLPPVVITSVYRNVNGVREYFQPGMERKIILKHNEYSVTIEFAALEFTNPARNRFMYQLEGVDDAWIENGSRNFIAFSNLAAGKYFLNIRGSNNDGIWNEEPARLQIVVLPPWWKSNGAYAAYFILTGLLILLAFRRREYQYLRDKRILEEKVSERTLQIEEQKAEIVQKNKELNELNASKDKFFSIIAHDLRNPFNYISGITDLLLRDLQGRNQDHLEEAVRKIQGSSRQAHELLENLLQWARSHTGTMPFQPERVEVNALIAETIDLLQDQASRKNIEIHSGSGQTVIASLDAQMIRTVLRNLLANAIKFTYPGGKIWINLQAADRQCILVVKDNGTGIPPEKLKTLFLIDTRHTTKGTHMEPGTGLGLILCKELVERHHGRLEVLSKPGEGSEFRVFLPLDQN